MTPLQVGLKLQAILAARVWTGGAGKVFSSVHISARDAEMVMQNLRLPAALVRVGGATPDDEAPGLIDQIFIVRVVAAVAGDALGENVLLGANKTAGTSLGRGILEIEVEVKAAVQQLGPVNGVKLQEYPAGDTEVTPLAQVPYAAYRDYAFRCWCTTATE